MNILIIGSDANAYSLAKKIKENKNVDIVFVAPGNEYISEIAQSTNIQERNIEELLDFAIANEISLTIVTSRTAIENNIAELFTEANQTIVAPTADAALVTLSKATAKKMMYRLNIPTVKFGIFERENQAIDYISKERKALVVKHDYHIINEYPVFTATFSQAKKAIEKAFSYTENKVIIEDYIDAKEVTMYFITDGYSAYPIGSCCIEDKELANSRSVFSPDDCISEELERKIINEVVYPVIDDIAAKNQAYCGILGVDLFVDGDNYKVIEFNPFFKQLDFQAILPTIKSDITDIFYSTGIGSLSDEYKYILFNRLTTFSKIAEKPIEGKENDDSNLDISYTNYSNAIYTQKARTVSKAKEYAEDNIKYLTEKADRG
jgi:phosphoribosylamine--glycine ligase